MSLLLRAKQGASIKKKAVEPGKVYEIEVGENMLFSAYSMPEEGIGLLCFEGTQNIIQDFDGLYNGIREAIDILNNDGVMPYFIFQVLNSNKEPIFGEVIFEQESILGLCASLPLFAVVGEIAGVTDCSALFYGCQDLMMIPSFTIHDCNTYNNMFEGCISLSEANMYFSNTGRISTVNMFSECALLTGEVTIDSVGPYTVTDMFTDATQDGGGLTFYCSGTMWAEIQRDGNLGQYNKITHIK